MKKIICRLLPVLGFILLVIYINKATVDVVYTDYIRLINSYLPDVVSLKPYLQGDVLTRTPITYLERLLNVKLFGYSTTFDMILGAGCMAVAAGVIGEYMNRMRINIVAIILIMFVMFSLDKWELFTNGTCWVHIAAYILFYCHFEIYDRVRNSAARRGDSSKLIWLPFITVLLFAGPYSAIYSGALIVVYVLDALINKGDSRRDGKLFSKAFFLRTAAVVIPTLLYVLSRAASVEEHAGATTDSFMTVFMREPKTIIGMFVKSFASAVIGGETATQYNIPGKVLWIIGGIVMLAYLWAIVMNFKSGLYKKTAMPLLLITAGLISHGLIVMSRWIFVDDMYGMSSRYALQFQTGMVGILLTFILARKHHGAKQSSGIIKKLAIAAFMFIVITGHAVTNTREIRLIPARRAAFENMRNVAVNFETEDDEELRVLQYSKPEKTREALQILKDNKLNVFSDTAEQHQTADAAE